MTAIPTTTTLARLEEPARQFKSNKRGRVKIKAFCPTAADMSPTSNSLIAL
jgi:hypothetical protein